MAVTYSLLWSERARCGPTGLQRDRREPVSAGRTTDPGKRAHRLRGFEAAAYLRVGQRRRDLPGRRERLGSERVVAVDRQEGGGGAQERGGVTDRTGQRHGALQVDDRLFRTA